MFKTALFEDIGQYLTLVISIAHSWSARYFSLYNSPRQYEIFGNMLFLFMAILVPGGKGGK